MTITTITIAGMLSVHSVRAVYTALAGIEGITRADVALGRATIEHDGRVSLEQIARAIAVVGCEVVDAREERRGLPIL
jgi:copper chaperone CopZ